MLLDSGRCSIYRTEMVATGGMKPKKQRVLKSEHYFGERTVGVTRYRAAMQNNERVDMVIRIWQDRDIRPNDECGIDGLFYTVRQVQQTVDEDGLRVTDLELERMDADDAP